MQYLFFGTSKTFIGQVSYGNLLDPGQASFLTISTTLSIIKNILEDSPL